MASQISSLETWRFAGLSASYPKVRRELRALRRPIASNGWVLM